MGVSEKGALYKIDQVVGSITCLVCGATSYNPHDVEHHYCGNCHCFLDDYDRSGATAGGR